MIRVTNTNIKIDQPLNCGPDNNIEEIVLNSTE